MADLLRSWPARAGDCFYLPSGTPHALGAGMVVAEIQTPSDVTYRLYDWDRPGTDGRPRELHLDAGLANLRLDVRADQIAQPRRSAAEPGAASRVCECERFTIDQISTSSGQSRIGPSNAPRVWIVLNGTGVLRSPHDELSFEIGDVVLIPAACGTLAIESPAEAELLEVRLP